MSKEKKASYGAGSLALLLSVIGIIFVVNYLADGVIARLDLTKNQRYTLSSSTKQILAGLPEVVTIKAVYSSNMPSQLKLFTKDVDNLLDEYQTYGKGKVKLEQLDPAGDKELQADLGKLGIYPISLTTQGLDQAGIMDVYAAIMINYLDKSEVIPQALATDTMEYDLTSVILRLSTDEKDKVGFFNPGQTRKILDEFGRLKGLIERQFEVIDVDNHASGRIDPALKVLIVANPYGLTDRDLYDLDQYIMNGGQVVFLTESTRVILQPNQIRVPEPVYAMGMNEQTDQLGPLLSSYGVTRNYDLVAEPKNYASYPIVPGLAELPYPPFMIEQPSKEGHRLLEGIDVLVFAWASSLKISDPLPPGVAATALMQTTPEAFVQTGNQLMVDVQNVPKQAFPIPGMGPGQRDLIVLLSGKFPSYFAGKEEPEPVAGSTAEPLPRLSEGTKDTNLLVVGNSYFVSEQLGRLLKGSDRNLAFLAGAVEWMAGGQGLADIGKRNSEPPPIKLDGWKDKVMVGLVLPLGAPFGIVVFGVVWMAIRRSKKRKFVESVQS